MEETIELKTEKKKIKRVVIADWLMTVILIAVSFLMELTMLFFNRIFAFKFLGVFFDLLFYAGLFFLINLIPHKLTKKILFTVLFTVISFIFIIDSIYSYYFGGFGSINSLRGVGTLTDGGDIGVKYTLSAIILTIVFASGIFIIWFFGLKSPKRGWLISLVSSLSLIGSLALSNSITLAVVKNRQYETRFEYYESNSFLYDYFYNSFDYVKEFGYINFRIRDIFYNENNSESEEVDDFFANIESSHENDFTAILEDYNIITMMCETLDTRILSETLTPNMVNVMKNSLVFDNWYTPTFFEGATINSEYMTNTSLIPTAPKAWGNNIAHSYRDNDWSIMSLPGQLSKLGYISSYLHLNNESFYMRDRFIPGLGFDQGYYIEDIPFETNHYDIHLAYLLDEYILKPYAINQDKFYVNMLNYSMHSGNDRDYATSDTSNPNYESYLMVQEKFPHLSSSTQTYYTKATMFDKYIGEVFSLLNNSEAGKNTIVLIYPDHYNYGDNGTLYSESELNIDENGLEKEINHQKMTMYLPEAARNRILNLLPDAMKTNNEYGGVSLDILASTIDIAPTVLNLVSSKGDFKYFMGNDFFGDQPKYVYFSDRCVFDGEVFLSLKDGIYGLSKLELSDEQIESHRELLQGFLENCVEQSIVSGVILSLDYFSLLAHLEKKQS